MARALYEPGYGYYTRSESPWEGQGDFVTGPQVDAAFGGSVAQLLRECDTALGEPACIDLLEMGGGDGSLLADVCDTTRSRNPALYERLRVWSIERSATLGEHQRRASPITATVSDGQTICRSFPTGSLASWCPMSWWTPYRCIVWFGATARRESSTSMSRMTGSCNVRDRCPPTRSSNTCSSTTSRSRRGKWPSCASPLPPGSPLWTRCLESGLVLTIDYGADTGALYAPERREGSLVCQFRYQLNDDPYVRVGNQDMSAQVDFGNLKRRGARLGLEVVGESGLAVFLVGFGAADGEGLPPRGSAGFSEALRRHQGLRHLLFSEMGDAHRVLLQAKHMPAAIEFGLDRLR